jgi:hypothetical protein
VDVGAGTVGTGVRVGSTVGGAVGGGTVGGGTTTGGVGAGGTTTTTTAVGEGGGCGVGGVVGEGGCVGIGAACVVATRTGAVPGPAAGTPTALRVGVTGPGGWLESDEPTNQSSHRTTATASATAQPTANE